MAGAQETFQSIPLLGWALGRNERVTRIEVRDRRGAFFTLRVNRARADIRAAFETVPDAATCGFEGEVGSATQPPAFELRLFAVTESGTRMPVAVVRGTRRPHAPRGPGPVAPLLLTTIGRSGSTWMTALCGQHPGILAHKPWGYEPRFASYWFEVMRALTHPSGYLQQVLPDIVSAGWWLGERSTTYHVRDREDPAYEDWLGIEEVDRTIDMCVERLLATYSAAAAREKSAIALAVDKCFPGHFVPPLVHELVPAAKEILLVRDFRDVACSVVDFSNKRGTDWNRPPGVTTDADYVRVALRQDAEMLLEDWREREGKAHLVRYEDLIARPQETLADLFSYLEVDASPTTVDMVLDRALAESSCEQGQHRTSSTVAASIGRWRREMEPAMVAACEESLAGPLTAFGYENQ